MKFKEIRLEAYNRWLNGTDRMRINQTDDFSSSYECDWQRKFEEEDESGDQTEGEYLHYSVFCSIGEWNTIMTDHLTDERFDDLDFKNDEDQDVLFRQFTKIFLTASEIMTDFQDLLSIFRNETILTDKELSDNKKESRKTLDSLSTNGGTQRFFAFINNVCKHKINGFHVCNHHLHLSFEDCPNKSGYNNTIRINNVTNYIPKNPSKPSLTIKKADSVEMPKLNFIITTILNSYKIVDEAFRKDRTKFEKLCALYEEAITE